MADLLKAESAAGVVLTAAAVAALVWATAWPVAYEHLWGSRLAVDLGPWRVDEAVRHWAGDVLLSVFFLVVGLEIKRELVSGHLRDRRVALLSGLGALGGMAVAALVFLAVAAPVHRRAWAVPLATDVAFALGAVSIVRRWVPDSGKVLLLTLAVIDDVAIVAVLALAYSTNVRWVPAAGAAIALMALVAGPRSGLPFAAVAALAGTAAWVMLLAAGLPPILAAVGVGLAAPPGPAMEGLERVLARVAGLVAVPLFVLTSAGVPLHLPHGDELRLAMAVVAALVVGKPLGVMAGAFLTVRSGLGRRPPGLPVKQAAAVACFTGMGFDVPLLAVALAFPAGGTAAGAARLGVVGACALAALVAMAAVRLTGGGPPRPAVSGL